MLHRPSRTLASLHLCCKGVNIPMVESAKYLGIIIDQHLSFKAQVDHVCDKVNQKLGSFRHGRRHLTTAARRLFYLSIIQSTLEYASSAYIHSLSSTLHNKLVICSHLAMKKVFGLSRRTPTDLVLRKFQLYSLEQRLNLKLYVLVYRSVYLLTSPLLSQLFVTRAAGHRSVSTTRGQSSLALELPSTKSRYGLHAVSFLAADRWNSLPSSCRQARSAAEFASLVKRYLGYPVKRHCL